MLRLIRCAQSWRPQLLERKFESPRPALNSTGGQRLRLDFAKCDIFFPQYFYDTFLFARVCIFIALIANTLQYELDFICPLVQISIPTWPEPEACGRPARASARWTSEHETTMKKKTRMKKMKMCTRKCA